jgi:galacturonosyltransferase
MKILLIGNSDLVLFNFRKELISALIAKGHEVFISCPNGHKVTKLVQLGCKFYSWKLNRHSINPFNEMISFISLGKIIKQIKPNFILSFTIKPNIYSGLYSRFYKYSFIPNITGLGLVFRKKSLLRSFIIQLYRFSFIHSKAIFLQNSSDFDLFKTLRIYPNKLSLLPGSGVNIDEFTYSNYPTEEHCIKFLYSGRIMREKGFDLFLSASKIIKATHSNTSFIVCGFAEEGYENILKRAIKENIIEYRGNLVDVKPLIREVHCIIQPSFYPEGISNVILEAASMGRPVIASTNPGCKDAVLDNVTGLIFQNMNLVDLISKINKFISLNPQSKIILSLNARKYIIETFNRDLITNFYLGHLH